MITTMDTPIITIRFRYCVKRCSSGSGTNCSNASFSVRYRFTLANASSIGLRSGGRNIRTSACLKSSLIESTWWIEHDCYRARTTPIEGKHVGYEVCVFTVVVVASRATNPSYMKHASLWQEHIQLLECCLCFCIQFRLSIPTDLNETWLRNALLPDIFSCEAMFS